MKILVIQLARLGDIYQTWPALQALRNKYPQAQIDALVRKKFAAAIKGHPSVDNVIKMDTAKILKPILTGRSGLDASLEEVKFFVNELAVREYHLIINLSFSPFSSYLTEAIRDENTDVCGYSRFVDGSLQIIDDSSAYFYAQVGPGKVNRFHLTEIFGSIANVEVSHADLHMGESIEPVCSFVAPFDEYILVHPFASQQEKCLPLKKWKAAIEAILQQTSKNIVIVGGTHERPQADALCEGLEDKRMVNLVGMTSVEELYAVVKGAEAVVATDSVCVQVANLCGIKSFCASFSTVNFWETGPIVKNSQVYYNDFPHSVITEDFCRALILFMEGQVGSSTVKLQFGLTDGGFNIESNFAWDMTRSLYLGNPLPILADEGVFMGLLRLRELVRLAFQQFEQLKSRPLHEVAPNVLARVDEMIHVVGDLVVELRPLVSWFETQKLRIGPGPLEQVLAATQAAFADLDYILSFYIGVDENLQKHWKPNQEAEHAECKVDS